MKLKLNSCKIQFFLSIKTIVYFKRSYIIPTHVYRINREFFIDCLGFQEADLSLITKLKTHYSKISDALPGITKGK